MPPRYAYWTILVDDQPTAFRAGAQDELMPTFKRLKEKHPSAVMKWFQNGKLWDSRIDAQEFMRARGEMGRRGDERQAGRSSFGDRGGFRDRKPFGERSAGGKRSAWTPRGEPSTPPAKRNADDKLEWKPKGEFTPAPKRSEKPDWKPKDSGSSGSRFPAPRSREKSDWKPKGSFDRDRKSEWTDKTHDPRPRSAGKPEWKPKDGGSSGSRFPTPDSREKPEWKPKGSFDRDRKSEWTGKTQDPRPRSAGKPEWKSKGERSSGSRFPTPASRPFKRPDFKPSGDDTRSAKPEWKPKGSFDRNRKSEWTGKTQDPRPRSAGKPEWKPKDDRSSGSRFPTPGSREKLDWKPKGEFTPAPKRESTREWTSKSRHTTSKTHDPGPTTPEKRKWMPKEEYKKSKGIEAKKDKNWRPGGDHKDPRQKYKDAKKAKWTKFKKNIRSTWESKTGKKRDK
jgi:hypothetical protein